MGCSLGLAHAGGRFGSAPAHGPPFPIPLGQRLPPSRLCHGQAEGTRVIHGGRSLPQYIFSLRVRPRETPQLGGWSIPLDYATLVARSGKALFVPKTPAREKMTSYSKPEAFLAIRRGGQEALPGFPNPHRQLEVRQEMVLNRAGCNSAPGMPQLGQSLQPFRGSAPHL